MKKLIWAALAFLLVPLLGGCESVSSSSSSYSSLIPNDVECHVYDYVPLPSLDGAITYSYEGQNIEIDEKNHSVCGTLADTATLLLMDNGSKKILVNVKVLNRPYSSKHSASELSEGWFNDVSVSPIEGINPSFASGIDVSSSKELYDAGQKFYNASGVEESLFRILKDSGVNWARLRLWNDPYNHNFLDKDGNPTPYGGGVCDLPDVIWMAREAKRFGLQVYLDFHFSDFWADPSNQVIPKAWSGAATADELAGDVSTYVTSTLEAMKEAEALPNLVSLGNETIAGMFLSLPGADYTTYSNGNPGYIANKTTAPATLAGKIGSANLVKYLKAGVDAVKAVDPTILTMIHMAKGLSAKDYIKSIYDGFSSINYDIIGLSGYSYWHFSTMSVLKSAMEYLSAAFPSKKICLAETSYGFTYEEDVRCQNSFSLSSDTCRPVSGYPVTTQGQASILRDTMAEVVAIPNGFGVFYWEGAWTATAFCGWADKTSLVTWANQGLFSYNGKALGSLKVYSKIRG